MAGEIQLNGTTALTESGGEVTLNNVDSATNRTNLGLGSIATQATDSVSISGGNITGGTIGSGVVFPAGHIIGYVYGSYAYTADNSVGGTAEVVGPVVSLTLKNANAKLFVINCYGHAYAAGGLHTIRLAYKTSSFSAGDGATSSSQGTTTATAESGTSFPLLNYVHYTATIPFICNVVNTANQTLYFANEVISTGTFYNNYAGNAGSNQTITIFELSK